MNCGHFGVWAGLEVEIYTGIMYALQGPLCKLP